MYEKMLHEAYEIENDIINETETDNLKQLEKITRVLFCYKEMYKLAKEKGSPTFFLNQILEAGFQSSLQGHHIAKEIANPKYVAVFETECNNFSKMEVQ